MEILVVGKPDPQIEVGHRMHQMHSNSSITASQSPHFYVRYFHTTPILPRDKLVTQLGS